jgi:hypothetical protein
MAEEKKRKSNAELYQEYQASKNSTTKNTDGNESGRLSNRDLYMQYTTSKLLEQNPTIIEDFGTRMKNYTEQYNSFFNTYRRKDFARNTANHLETEANELKKLLNDYGILFDDDYVTEATEFLNGARTNLNNGVKHWSQWETRDDYDASVRMNGYYTKYQGAKPEDEANALEDLQLRYTEATAAGSEEAKLLQEEIDYLYNYGSKETQISGRKKQYDYNSTEATRLDSEIKAIEGSVGKDKSAIVAEINSLETTMRERENYYRRMGNSYERSKELAAEANKKETTRLAELKKALEQLNPLAEQRDAIVAENNRYDRGEGTTDRVYTEYKHITEKPDFTELSKAKEYVRPKGDITWSDDLTYDYINNEGVRGTLSARATMNGGGNPLKIYDQLNEDEIAIYNYIHATEGKDSAEAYLKKLESALEIRSTDYQASIINEAVKNDPFSATVLNIGSVVAKPFGDLIAFADSVVSGKDYNPYSQWHTMSNNVNAIRTATTEAIEANTNTEFLGQNVWSQIYNAGMSTLDSIYGVAMFGKGYSLIASSGAAVNKAAELYKKGATGDQIFWGGTAAGLAEAIFEKVSIDNLIKAKNPDKWYKILWEAFKQAGIEGSEELATEIANIASDNAIMGSQSDFNLAIKAYQDEGLSYDEAYAKAKQDKLNDIIWAGLSGFMSGGASGGITTTHQGISNAVAGKDIKKQGDTEAMILAGIDAQQGSQAYKLAEKVFKDYTEGNGKVSNMRLGALKQTTMEDAVDQYRNRETLSESDIQAKLESRGIDSTKAAEFASIVAKVAKGNKLSERETEALKSNEDAQAIANEIATAEAANNFATNIQLAKIDSLGREAAPDTPDTYDVSKTEGKTLVKDSGAEVKIVDIDSLENGKMMLKVKEGTEGAEAKKVNAENIAFATNEEAILYESVAQMDIDAASAKAIIGNFDAKSKISARNYIYGAHEAFTYGKYNFSPEEMSQKGFSAYLTEEQKTFAYNLGKNVQVSNVDAQEGAIKKAIEGAKTNNKTQNGKKGKVHYEGVKTDRTAFTDRQSASVDALEVIAKALGVDIYLYESELDGKGRRAYIDKDGNRITANGFYDPRTGDIHIDIHAGQNAEQVMLFTAAHELTHFVRQWSPAKFKVLADFLMAEYGKEGVPVAELVRHQQDLAAKQGRKLSYDTAYEEMVADSMQTMLSDGAVVEKLAKLTNKDKTLVEKMKDWLDKLVKDIKREYAKETPYNDAGEYAAMLKEGERLQELFYDALVSAGENYRGAGGKTNIANAEMKLMARELGNDLGNIERTDNGDITLITNKDNSLLLYSARTYEEGGREKLEATLKANGHTQEEINDTLKLIDDAADYLRILAAGYAKQNYGKFGERLSEHLEATVTTDLKGHKQVLSTLVNNGDYPVNLDLALICKKRVAYMRLMTRLIEDGVFGDVVYGGDAIAEVNAILREDGFETACLGCFVESRRLQFQTWAETIVQEWNEAVDAHTKNAGYFGFAKGGKGNLTEADMDAMETELKGQKKNDKGNVNLGQGSAVTRMNRLLDKMPSLAKKLTVDDLLTPQGLTTLRQADGNLFSIVKSRYGAASPKIVQEFSPYASEIANLTFSYVKKMTGESISGGQGYIRDAQKELATEKPVKQKGESKEDFKARKKAWDDKVETLAMNNYLFAIGGARIQSFSDFMIENVFDYIQIMADLAAKGSPLHGYTKEIACLRLFGMTGAKWNGSLIAHVDRSMGKEMAGLLHASEAKNGNAILVHTPKGDYAIGFDDYARHMATNKKSFIQSIGMKDIVALMLDPRYSANVGNITIGVSDMQILGMLDSPLFRMVIPYHASGMLPQFAQLVGVDFYNDYTNYQNTTVKEYFDLEGNPIEELKKANGDILKPDMSYKYNEKVQELSKKGVKDAPRQAANDYIAWCGKMHPVYDGEKRVGYATLKPKFSDSPYGTDFSKHKNYYKLLEDFNMYDNNTEAVALQEAVKMVLPSEANRLNTEQMEAYKQALRDTGIFTEADITKYAKKADMTFEEIIKAEMDNRQAYEEETDPKWDATVKKVEDHLKKHHPRDGQAKSAEDYKNAKGDGTISKIKAVDGSYAFQLAPNEIMRSERDFSYDELVAKDDLQGVVIKKSQQPKIVNGLIDAKYIEAEVKKQCEALTSKAGITYWTNVPDIGANVEITNKGITHGFARPNDKRSNHSKPTAITNARVAMAVPQILTNSIEVNRSQRGKNLDVPYTHVLIGTVALEDNNGGLEYYAVRSMVQERKNQNPVLVEANILGRLTSSNAKKIDSPAVQVGNTVALTGGRVYAYSIADLLNDVKDIFDDTFSEDVYNHFSRQRKDNDFSKNLLFSERDLAPTFYSKMGKVVEAVKQEKLGASSVIPMLTGKGVKAEEIRWSGIHTFLDGKKSVTKQELLDFINGSMLEIGEQMSSNNIDLRYDGSNRTYSLYDESGNVVNTFTYNEFMGGYVSENDDEIYTDSVELEDALREEYGSMSSPRWGDYKLDGGSNYREIVFTMPNSSYSNQMMRTHWGEDAEGVLAHARIQDFTVNGKKMLFIEEIQSDWHNEGHKEGYEADITDKERAEFIKLKKDITFLNEQHEKVHNEKMSLDVARFREEKISADEYFEKATVLNSKLEKITAKLNRTINKREKLGDKIRKAAPDAPFKDNYHEFVLKRLLRMAAEQGYDSIGWTPADIQSKRWSDEFAEGYRIEYDQDMPKFLNKYGRQWGAKVENTYLNKTEATSENVREYAESLRNDASPALKAKYSGTKVWSMDITDAMKNSVLYEGQVLYSERNVKPITETEYKSLEKHFGTTGNFRVAGYLLTDGKLLDFSGKHWGDTTSRMRQVDHRDVSEVLNRGNNGVNDMVDMIGNGNIRLMPEIGGINLATYPNEKQRRVLSIYIKQMLATEGQVIIDYDAVGGDTVYSRTYEKYASSSQILADIRNYFNGARQSELMSFHTMYSERDPNATSNRSLLANALENAAQNDIEKNKLKQYKEKIDFINAEERKLADLNRQLKELRFSKGKRDTIKAKKIRDLQAEATKTANRISIYDKQLLNLEASTPLKNVLEREKAKARKLQKQRDAEFLQEQKDKANATIREILNRNTESRKRAVEGRHKTIVRNKIKRTIKDLNQVFNRGTKERNVKIGLREAVHKALEASEVLFSDEITNEDIVRLGVDSVSEQDSEKLERYATLLALRETKEEALEISRINSQISKLNSELKDVFIRERARLNKENVSSALDSLAEAYASLQNSDDDYIKNNAFVQGMHDRIKSLSENLNGVIIKDMSLEQLEQVYKMYSSVKHMIVNANSIFRDGLREDLSKKIMTVQGEILELQKDNRKDPRVIVDAINNAIKSFDWNNQKPVYAFEKLGSQAFQELFWDAVKAEGVYAQDVKEAGDFLDAQKDKFKYADWDFRKAKTFKSANGLDFKLTLSDMMSIYAYSKRPQAFDHMTQGGFTFDRGSEYVDEKGRKRKHVRLTETYTVSIELINEIVKTLSEEQIGYVDAVQAYLTSLGEKGNEISRTLYGIDLFTEKAYFPLKSDADYRSSVEQALNETQTQVSLKNTGMTKQTVPHANNPIVLQGFDDVVLGHVDNMSKYHSFVLPIENLRRVFDNVSRDENAGYDATKVIVESVFGESAKQYFDQYITDLNGGVHIGGYQNIMMDMFSKMKKTAVSASLSVVVQQPFAITRAMDMINPVYFTPVNFDAARKNTDAKSQWEELKKYAPVAIIKEMGGFDVGSSRTTRDYIGGANYKGFGGRIKGFFKDSDYRSQSLDNIFMWGASKADQIGWSAIWKAIKREVASQHKELAVGSEAFLEKCGERFTEVIVYTQVYDSVNSRSGMMRSKRDLDKFATSFMGEPTTTINMVENRMLQLARAVKTKDGKAIAKATAKMGRTVGVTLGSILLTSLAKSLVYAGRDDDEKDKALLERWAKSFGDSLTNDLNPLTMIPYLRDFVSIWEGWDIERPDMTVVADIVTSIKKAIDEGCDLEEALALIGNAGNAFGLPVKNLIREAQGVINVFNDIADDIEPTDIGGAFMEGWTGEEKSKKDSLYQALVSGDESRIAVLRTEYKTEDAYEQAIRKGLRENDPRIREAAQARIDGDISEYSVIVREIKAEGHFSQDTIVAAVNAEINLINKETKEQNAGGNDEIEDTEEKASSIYKASDINAAFDNGDTNMALTIIKDLVVTKVSNGMTEKEAQSSVRSSITSYWKPLFLEAYNNKDSAEQQRIRRILIASGLYGRTSEVIKTTQQWIKDSKKKK